LEKSSQTEKINKQRANFKTGSAALRSRRPLLRKQRRNNNHGSSRGVIAPPPRRRGVRRLGRDAHRPPGACALLLVFFSSSNSKSNLLKEIIYREQDDARPLLSRRRSPLSLPIPLHNPSRLPSPPFRAAGERVWRDAHRVRREGEGGQAGMEHVRAQVPAGGGRPPRQGWVAVTHSRVSGWLHCKNHTGWHQLTVLAIRPTRVAATLGCVRLVFITGCIIGCVLKQLQK
jgi:hypothetical protein